ncbi:hypothetical protein [Cellulomonas sp. PhB143]|uniref:hypothetical protein n=1 Tax=Cellulomonas sp. PhB143 TaxID=2485186 RepID=UPI000F4A5ABC|nr:hypothetical protein [Cellulomonas sp. PhB143]ROS78688.1 hypothetical protein EDF32_0591 [Cellulomonas sp. PhB143]
MPSRIPSCAPYGRALAGLALLLVSLACAVGLASVSAGPARAAASPAELCAAVARLTDAGHPRAARDTMDGLRELPGVAPDACADELEAATAQVRAAAVALRASEDAAAAGLWSDALDSAQEGADLDQDDPALRTRLQAAEDAVSASTGTRLGARWDAQVADDVVPLSGLALFCLGAVVVVLVAARCAVLLVSRWPRVSDATRIWLVVLGGAAAVWAALLVATFVLVQGAPTLVREQWFVLAAGGVAISLGCAVAAEVLVRGAGADRRARRAPQAVLVASLLAAVALPPAVRVTSEYATAARIGPVTGPGLLLVALALAGTSAVLLATAVATRLRISVEARDSGAADVASAARISAAVAELAGSPPAGLRSPEGTDTAALGEDAISELPHGKILSALARLLQAVVVDVPWRLTVDAGGSPDVAVTLTRNGRQVAAAVIRREELRRCCGTIEPTDDDLRLAVAAFAVTNLARYHDGFDGLCGASDWLALAVCSIATTGRPDGGDADHGSRRAALASAVEIDPGAWLAQSALALEWLRGAPGDADRLAYETWATEFLDRGPADEPGFAALRLRVLYVRATATLNRWFDALPPRGPVPRLEDTDGCPVATCVVALFAALDEAHEEDDTAALRTQLASASYSMRLRALDGPPPGSEPDGDVVWPAPPTPTAEYNVACYLAGRRPGQRPAGATTKDRDLAARHLARALLIPEYRDLARADPMLRAVVRHPDVRPLLVPA